MSRPARSAGDASATAVTLGTDMAHKATGPRTRPTRRPGGRRGYAGAGPEYVVKKMSSGRTPGASR